MQLVKATYGVLEKFLENTFGTGNVSNILIFVSFCFIAILFFFIIKSTFLAVVFFVVVICVLSYIPIDELVNTIKDAIIALIQNIKHTQKL